MTTNRSAHRAPRLIVSFSGLDGAGKTHQIDVLAGELGQRRRTEVLWVPFAIWPEPLLARLPASFRSRLGPKRRSASATSADGPVKPRRMEHVATRARGLIWALVGCVAAISAGVSLRRRVARSNAELLVLDRYRIDSIVKLQYWYPDVPASLLAAVVRALAPAPDLEIYLRVDANVAYRRKPEQWTPEQLAQQAELYDRVTQQLPAVLVLDGHDDPEAVTRAIRDGIDALR